MASEMQFVITENNQIIKTLTHATIPQPAHLVKSLQDFQKLVNAAITKIIDDRGGNNQEENEGSDEDSEEDEDAVAVTPKKRRK